VSLLFSGSKEKLNEKPHIFKRHAGFLLGFNAEDLGGILMRKIG
jgi:hypothetical protein